MEIDRSNSSVTCGWLKFTVTTETVANAYEQVANSERGQWLLFDEYHPRNVTASYKELEWE